MLHILMLILKIIGIILLSIIGILLLGLCLALFVPVHYQIEAQRLEGEGNPPIEATAKITWLLHFINIRIKYPAEVYLKAKVMFIPIFQMPPKPKKEKTNNEKAKKEKLKKEKPEKEKIEKVELEKKEIEKVEIEKEEIKKEETEKSEIVTQENSIAEHTQSKNTTTSNKVKEPIWEKIKKFFAKICQFFRNIRYTITGIYDKIKKICENIEYYLGVLQSDTFKQAFALCKEELGAVLRYIKPRKLKAELTIGMEDPATTGQILSYYGILYPFIGNHVTVIGDFENKRIEGNVFIKGKIKLFTMLKAGIRIYFNKDIRKLLKLFKKEEL
ncbi:MAG: DUF2953 domain-containing protein [Lachnospiraceae bacterium]|nr:DUF2953 domain-containing protein [Lachnospiraceae bacterium]